MKSKPYNQYQPQNQKNSHIRDFHLQSVHIQFQTNDSSQSDKSYQSSLSSNQQNNLGSAQYFREQMSRFFINYPQLLNNQLIGQKRSQKNLWQDLANDIMHEAKQQPISLQGIAKRIAFYRQKTQQIDVKHPLCQIIDLIIKQKDQILKQLDEQQKLSIKQNITTKIQQSQQHHQHTLNQNNQNIYYSWKKQHQNAIKSQLNKHYHHHHCNSASANKKYIYHGKEQGKKCNSVYHSSNINANTIRKFRNGRSLTKFANSHPQNNKHSLTPTTANKNPTKSQPKQQPPLSQSNQNKKVQYQNQSNQLLNILQFQPKTEAAKQLLQQIKKHNLSDQISIKKTIVTFLHAHRDSLKKALISKSTINQRLSKLHLQDSKQLLLFFPLKKYSQQIGMPLNNQTNAFLQILNQISTGHLMKYWKLLQQKKI